MLSRRLAAFFGNLIVPYSFLFLYPFCTKPMTKNRQISTKFHSLFTNRSYNDFAMFHTFATAQAAKKKAAGDRRFLFYPFQSTTRVKLVPLF